MVAYVALALGKRFVPICQSRPRDSAPRHAQELQWHGPGAELQHRGTPHHARGRPYRGGSRVAAGPRRTGRPRRRKHTAWWTRPYSPRRLAEPGVQCAECQEDRGSEAGESNSGIRQTGLPSRDHASEAARCGVGFRINRNPGHTPPEYCTHLTWCFPGRCTLTCSRRRFPVFWSSFLSAVGELSFDIEDSRVQRAGLGRLGWMSMGAARLE